jgi:alpha,alpha-trehalase
VVVSHWSEWSLIYDSFQPEQEKLREALCTLGNGYFATRGAGHEAKANDMHYPGTYLAGGYNRLQTELAGRIVENEDLVNLPNWLLLNLRVNDGEWFSLHTVDILAYRQELDLKRGVLLRSVRFRDDQGRQTTLTSRRMVHMREFHLAALEMTVTAENWAGDLTVRSALDGRVVNAGVERYRELNHQHLEALDSLALESGFLLLNVQTTQSKLRIAEAAQTQIFQNGRPVEMDWRTINEPGYAGVEGTITLAKGQAVSVEKILALYTSRDLAISECGLAARTAIARATGFSGLLKTHADTWAHLWKRFDITFEEEAYEGPHKTSLILRLHIFHLLQVCSPHTMDLDVGAPARGLHGEAYRGHIFWDEIFIFPFLNLRMPEITRSLLMYRYRRLPEAQWAAKEEGFRGAMYPWQSGSDGREESQVLHLNPKSGRWIPDNSHRQRHITAAIAYDIWQYYQVTGDREFLCFYGAEMFLNLARFWASLATYNDEVERYEILGVMGPDEYHDAYPDHLRREGQGPGLHNNAYTNLMAVWVLWRALEILESLSEDWRRHMCETFSLTPQEIQLWERISRKMRVVFHNDGIISQFEGYDRLEEFAWEAYRQRYGDIQRLDRVLEAEGDTPNRYKVSKQADVLMLFYLFSSEELSALFERLGYPFDADTIPKNIEYYLQRTSHGSTLSRIVHSWVLARANRPGAWNLFVKALESDLLDIQGGTTAEGVHLGAMAGTVDLIQRCFTGIEMRDDVLWLNPLLPKGLRRLGLQLHYREHSLEVTMTHQTITIRGLPCRAKVIKIGFKGQVHELAACDTKEFQL